MADNQDVLSPEDLLALHQTYVHLQSVGDPRAEKLRQYLMFSGKQALANPDANQTQFEQNGGKMGDERIASPTPENGILSRAANFVRGGVATVTAPLLHPQETVEGAGQGMIAGGSTPYGTPLYAPTGNRAIDQQNEQNHQDVQQQAIASGADQIKNHPAYLAGSIVGPALLGKAVSSPQVRGAVGDLAGRVTAKIPATVSDGFQRVTAPLRGEPMFPSKMAEVVPEAQGLPQRAIEGVEGVIRVAAPTGMNKGFKANAAVAAGDMAEIANTIDLNRAKGGIVNADYRLSSFVNGIREHLNEMYQTERAPQIQAHADVAVKVGASEDAANGLEYLSKAGDETVRTLADKAISGENLSLAEADTLAKAANQNLHTFEKMTPEGKVQATITNPKIGGLKALDAELGNTVNDTLRAQGAPGIRSYERRFAALSAIRDAIEARTNPTELQRSGPVKMLGKIIAPLTGGKANIASASQAAVADISAGRMLQKSLAKLQESGIKPRLDSVPSSIPLRLAESARGNPLITPSPADPSGLKPSVNIPFENTTRAQRLGLLLPEKTAIDLGPGADQSGTKVLKPNVRIVRDPKTGKMKRQYLNN